MEQAPQASQAAQASQASVQGGKADGEKTPRAPGSVNLAAEYAQLALTREIIEALKKQRSKSDWSVKQLYELDNVVERWLIAMANAARGPGDQPNWARVYCVRGAEEAFNRQLARELVEKKLVRNDRVGAVVSRLLELIRRRLGKEPSDPEHAATCDATHIRYGSQFVLGATPRVRAMIDLGGCGATVGAALRYAAVHSRGQQWAVPRRVCDRLYEESNLRNEGFASPFNACLLGKKDARFCSVFPDVDRPFGSIGSFFETRMAEHEGAWLVNPPFVEELLGRAAAHVLASLRGGLKSAVFFVGPAWTDSAFWTALHKSGLVVAERLLRRGTYAYEDVEKGEFSAKFDSYFWALAADPSSADRDALRASVDCW